MQATTYTSYDGRRSLGSKKNFVFQKGGSLRKPGTICGCPGHISNSAVEIIKRMPDPGPEQSLFKPSASQPEEEAPADEFDSSPSSEKDAAGDTVGTEAEKGDPANKVPSVFLQAGAGFRRKHGEGKLLKSVTCTLIPQQLAEETKEKQEATLRGSKSPDPFEDKHVQSETQLIGLINNTTNPENPLSAMQKSGGRSSAELKAYKHFIISLFESACFIRKMEPVSEAKALAQQLSLPRPKGLTSNKTVVLDLDETLVHCVDEGQPFDLRLMIELPEGIIARAGINIRPGAARLLEVLSKSYEVIVFTASHQSYADAILDHIENGKTFVHHRLYRQNCIRYQGNMYIKDLRVLGRELKNVVIVDNAPYSFASQMDNGYPIIPFYDNKSDEELTVLLGYLQNLENVGDVRAVNRDKFRFREITETNICDYAQYYLQTNSDASATEQSQESLSSFGDESPKLPEKMYEKVKAPLRQLQSNLAELFKPKA